MRTVGGRRYRQGQVPRVVRALTKDEARLTKMFFDYLEASSFAPERKRRPCGYCGIEGAPTMKLRNGLRRCSACAGEAGQKQVEQDEVRDAERRARAERRIGRLLKEARR